MSIYDKPSFAAILRDCGMDDVRLHAGESQKPLLEIVLNVMRGVESSSREADVLITWMSRNRQRLGLADGLFVKDDYQREDISADLAPINKARWHAFYEAVRDIYNAGFVVAGAHAEDKTQQFEALDRGLTAVSAALGFDELDAALFAIIVRYRCDSAFDRLFDAIASARGKLGMLRRYPDMFSLFIGVPATQINERFRADGQLLVSGAISIDDDGDINIAPRLRSLVEQCGIGNFDVRAELLGLPLEAKLPLTAFKHLGKELDVAFQILQRVLQSANSDRPEHGVHILLYGEPGTGKTECAQSLAEELGVPLHVVGEQSENGEEPSRSERLGSLLLAQRVGSGQPAIYLFDEAEDLFRPSSRDKEPDPKIFVHRLLETARVPMIWAANDLTAFTPAVLRRMSMCIEVRLPNQTRRAELWQELARAEKVALDAETAGRLARLIPSAPSVARTALRAARLGDGSAETAALVASGMARAIGHGRALPPEPEIVTIYNPALSNADRDLSDLTERLSRPGAPKAVSILLSGPPGTGKTAYARHLAGRMGLEVIQKRGSDIFGPYVGQTEANIATAFAEARATGSFLLFDEADSLLFDRSSAVRGWEVSQVNEMLTWMEQHPLPFACTTNLAERLDKASLRRFLVRLNFDFLLPDQAALLFRRSFGLEPPAALARLDRLTPADFSRIARRCAVFGMNLEAQVSLELLTSEIDGRDGSPRSIGFARDVRKNRL